MKRYQSHKIVEAAPIVAAEFNEDGSGKVVYRDERGGPVIVNVPAGFKRPNTEPQMDHDGGDYLVRYDGDYLSWSPKDKFEAGYTEVAAGDWKTRLQAEYAELCERMDKLRDYMRDNHPLPDDQRALLRAQEKGMGAYFHALAYRLEAAGLMKIDGPKPAELTQVDDVTVTVSAPPGKRAVVVTVREEGGSSVQHVTGGQSHSFKVAGKDEMNISEGQPHSTVAHQGE